MKRRLILLLIAIMLLLESGCSNKIELNRLGIISAIAFDMDESNQWVLTFQIIIPKSSQSKAGGGGSQSPVTVFSSKGKTILEAIQKSELEAPRHLFFSHTRVIIISQRVAKYGVNPILDAFLRSYESRENTNVLISEVDAKRVLEVLTPLENIPGNALSNLLSGQGNRQTNLVQSKLHEFISTMTNPSASATLPEIKIMGEQQGQVSLDALNETRSSAVLKLDRVAVFKQDKFAGWLNRKESLGIPWITNRLKQTTIVFSCEGESSREQLSSFLIEKSRTKLKPSISNGNLFMSVDINAQGNLIETACNLNLKHKSEALTKLEKYIQEQIRNDVENSFQAVKKMKADTLGFGDAFHKSFPREWKTLSQNWENEFTKIRMDINVKVTIRRTGMIDDSFSRISGKKE
ncbi:Ger(x)C family spore germination protein [Paenibacillus sedimenti]|uniref:Ger(X)C family spore germination protein n=1 Tax=Paenibacillus sedimenti TaxID=2770274 RepID=A0A926KVA2_9BACL|nr:Ger(x)C family spore germination protein [Paenibacillus sedimenti]MBD0383526.1 Ger(x)C family spore germination protein [Paenibacillus sedimenti]